MIYFTSDTHLGHGNIIRYCQRPFKNTDEMDQIIIDNINKRVQLDDELYILGDFTLHGSIETVRRYRRRLNCPKIHLLNGNHDKNYSQADIFTSVRYYKELRYNKRYFVLMHYPFHSWNRQLSHSIDLHGHQHNFSEYNKENIKNGLLRFDIGVDANDFAPVSIEQVIRWAEQAEKNLK